MCFSYFMYTKYGIIQNRAVRTNGPVRSRSAICPLPYGSRRKIFVKNRLVPFGARSPGDRAMPYGLMSPARILHFSDKGEAAQQPPRRPARSLPDGGCRGRHPCPLPEKPSPLKRQRDPLSAVHEGEHSGLLAVRRRKADAAHPAALKVYGDVQLRRIHHDRPVIA